jgi:hypothetical protein
MFAPLVRSLFVAGLLAGCAGQESIKPAEVLDERTGVTVGALQEPIEFVETTPAPVPGAGNRTSFAYLGPVEWDKSGDISYGLWIHVAPGTDAPVGDFHAPGAVTLMLEDGPVVLLRMDAPPAGRGPYRPIASWGQTAYFDLDVALLKRMAASDKITLKFSGAGAASVDFTATHGTHETLVKFLRARGITDG